MSTTTTYEDLSHPLNANVQVYPGDPPFSCRPILTIADDGMNVQSLSMGSHTGTHIDAPYHFLQDGATVDQIPLSACSGSVVVVDVTCKPSKYTITWADVSPYEDAIRRKAGLGDGVIVFLHTGWSQYWCSNTYFDHPFLDADAAKKLVECGVKVIGVDTLSPDETRTDGTEVDFAVHKVVLGAGVIIAENLTNLESIQTGDWRVCLAPLKLTGCDGSPVRAFAWKDGSVQASHGV